MKQATNPTDAELLPPTYRVALVRERCGRNRPTIDEPEDAHKLFSAYLADVDREHFVMMGLDAKSNVIGINTVHIGALTMSLVCPREVFKPALLMNASAIIVAHNHPSGDPTPSPEDIEVTRKLREISEVMNMPLLDHVIVGYDRCLSIGPF